MLNKAFNRLTGFADVEQRGNVIIISGVSASTLARDMKYIWNTSKIAGSMFIKATWSEIRIPTFFALEFQYILQKLIDSRGLQTSKRILKNVVEALETQTWIANISTPQSPWLDRAKLKEIIYPKLLPHQAEFLDIYESTRKRYGLRGMLLAAAPGAGKAQPLYSKIRTPSGWTTMGAIRVGDVVSTPDGSTGNVVGLFPQGVKDIYEVTLTSGERSRCCLEHLWPVWVPDSDLAEIIDTKQIIGRLKSEPVYFAVLSETSNTRVLSEIESIEFVGQEEAQCIMIDHPDHLYITDDYIVTHNTVSGCSIALTTNATKVIIVSPMNAIHKVWQKTLQTEFHEPQDPYVYKDTPNQLQPQKKWHIFHYEALEKAVELAKLFRGEKVCIIIDECHNFNEIKSMRTQRLLELGSVSKSEDIIWMSGTPVKALGFETIPLLKSIDPFFNEPTENAFRKMFGKDAKRTLDILAHRLGLVSHTVPKSEFMAEEPIYETIKVKMPHAEKYTLAELAKVMQAFVDERTVYYKDHKAEFQRIYDKCIDIHRATLKSPAEVAAFKEYQNTIQYLIRNGFDTRRDGELAILTNKYEKNVIHPSLPQELRKPFANAKSVIKYVELKIRGECLGRILTKERIQCHVDMLQHIDFKYMINGVKKKTLIFTNYVAVVNKCAEVLSAQGFKPLKVHAETNAELTSIISRFDKDPAINPLIATYDSLSTAVPLTMANGIIFLNNPWRSYIKDQAIARAWRVGQDSQVYGFDVILDTGSVPNISSRSLDIMQWSKDQVDRIMGTTGASEVSVEHYGMVSSAVADLNEYVEDVLYDETLANDNVVPKPKDEPVEDPVRMPTPYLFYSQQARQG